MNDEIKIKNIYSLYIKKKLKKKKKNTIRLNIIL
jgi:hypothetical protein